MHSTNDVASFFLSKSSMSPKKLQKLLYYAYAWSLALLNDNVDNLQFQLFDNKFQAWVHGPAIPSIYGSYKDYGWNDIPKVESFDVSIFGADVIDILNQVWNEYGKYSGNELEAISHKEAPWIEARKDLPAYASCSESISDKTIFSYYNSQAS